MLTLSLLFLICLITAPPSIEWKPLTNNDPHSGSKELHPVLPLPSQRLGRGVPSSARKHHCSLSLARTDFQSFSVSNGLIKGSFFSCFFLLEESTDYFQGQRKSQYRGLWGAWNSQPLKKARKRLGQALGVTFYPLPGVLGDGCHDG